MRYVALLLILVLGTACQQHLPSVQPAPPALSAAPSPTPVLTPKAGEPARPPTREATVSPQEASAGATKAAATVVPERVDYPTETPAAERPTFQTYTIREGDTLSGIAARFGISMDELSKVNSITDPNRIRIGQELKVPAKVEVTAPADRLIPDSEVVYGPTSTGFDIARFAQSQPGYLKEHSELVESRQMTGPGNRPTRRAAV
ncbi:MAG: LysM peptidoglycan-binding domain-containing protein [Anaerolineae bacterium]|nr:LysM peptidoglycan-binding domain-containing protein [Anaerolineae bacterium]